MRGARRTVSQINGRATRVHGAYVGVDGRERLGYECLACRGKGRMDWRDQRDAGLSANRDDKPFPCPRCQGTGVYWTTSGHPAPECVATEPAPTSSESKRVTMEDDNG